MIFHYQAADQSGKVTEGEAEARSQAELVEALRVRHLTLIRALPLAAWRAGSGQRWFCLWSGSISLREKIVFAGTLSAMISAGLSLSRALGVLERQASNKHFKVVLANLAQAIEDGSSLSEGLAAAGSIFPPVFVAMVRAGEQSGNLPQALESVRNQLSKSYTLRRRVQGAMIYPSIIILAIIAIAVLMMIYLVPNLTAIFLELKITLPLSTRIIIGTSNLLTAYWLIILVMVLSLVGGLMFWRRTGSGRRVISRLWLFLPLVSPMTKKFNAAIILRTLSSLITAGVGLIQALELTAQVVRNPYYADTLTHGLKAVEKGMPVSDIFRDQEWLYPPLATELVEVGEETGNLAVMMLRGAVFFEDEVEQATKNLSTIIEPVLMIIIGLAVGFFAVSVIGPIYSLSNSL